MNFALKPSFWIIRAYFRDARRESSSDLAPVTTILPDAKIKAVVFGSRILIITAAKRWKISTEYSRGAGDDIPWGCIRHFSHATQSSSNQDDNQAGLSKRYLCTKSSPSSQNKTRK